jgi:hypothetical protein
MSDVEKLIDSLQEQSVEYQMNGERMKAAEIHLKIAPLVRDQYEQSLYYSTAATMFYNLGDNVRGYQASIQAIWGFKACGKLDLVEKEKNKIAMRKIDVDNPRHKRDDSV